MESSDFLIALTLQTETEDMYDQRIPPTKKIINTSFGNPTVPRPLSVIDESWELLDPNPDVRALFLEFNDRYFGGKLAGVEVKWSPRMTLCAGVCSYEGHGGLCSIRLSVPLLKLRPRKDLVETLLHEMIHAFLFVTDNDRDREEHGPNFKNHMHRINKASGANVTIYHDFHDEVDSYRQHWWQCNGPCKSRPPYFGFVKRAMNRAPSPKDYWWGDHARSCGGTYTKVKEPEGFDKKNKRKTLQSLPVQGGDICKYFGKAEDKHKSNVNTKTSLVSTPSWTATSKENLEAVIPNRDITKVFPLVSLSTENESAKELRQSESMKPSTSKICSNSLMLPHTVGIWETCNQDNEISSQNNSGLNVRLGHFVDQEANGRRDWFSVTEGSGLCTDADGTSQKAKVQSDTIGHVLGRGPVGMNWLSSARQKWNLEMARNSVSSNNTISSIKFRHVTSDQMVERNSTSSSEASPIDVSFCVSSCEEDSWPTPESYYNKNCEGAGQKRKRFDVTQSDEDIDHNVPVAGKKIKLSLSAAETLEFNLRSSNIFEKVKQKTAELLPDKGINATQINERAAKSDALARCDVNISHSSKFTVTSLQHSNNLDSSCVTCPACQGQVSGSSINAHLDQCLLLT